jgi:hypothetical protein
MNACRMMDVSRTHRECKTHVCIRVGNIAVTLRPRCANSRIARDERVVKTRDGDHYDKQTA